MAKKKRKAIAEQTKRGPGRPKKNTRKKRVSAKKKSQDSKKIRSRFYKRWSIMHVRHLLYKHWPGRYDSFDETAEEAADAINYLRSLGHNRATIQGLREYVSQVKRVKASREKKKVEIPDWHLLIPSTIPIGKPISFFNASPFCGSWATVNQRVYCFSKDIWPGQRFYGGRSIDYSASFGKWARQMARLQRQKKGDYSSNWFFMLKDPEYDAKTGEFKIKIISSDSIGEHVKYKEDGSIEPGEEVQTPLPKGRVEPLPEPEEKPQAVPPAAPAAEEFTKEDRLQLEREKIKAEAEAKAKVDIDVKKAKLEQFTKLFTDNKITFEQYEKLVSTL